MNSFKRWYNDRYVNGWKVFEESKPIDRQGSSDVNVTWSRRSSPLNPNDRFVSWEAFIEYVAANPGDRAHDHHWRLQFNQCRICDLDYDLITHLENSDDEVDFILEKLKVEILTYVSSARDLENRFFSGQQNPILKITLVAAFCCKNFELFGFAT